MKTRLVPFMVLLSFIGTVFTTATECINNPEYSHNDDPIKTCDWISKSEKRRTRICREAGPRINCPVVCGLCCFNNDIETCLTYKNKKYYHCKDSNIRTLCPLMCRVCCSDDPHYRFRERLGNQTYKRCVWLKTKPRKRMNCKGLTKWKCNASCGPKGCFTPTEGNPTTSPVSSNPTTSPTLSPSVNPTTPSPTAKPTTLITTNSPTSTPTSSPSSSPTNCPTSSPTNCPTSSPTNSPTSNPTNSLTNSPTSSPTMTTPKTPSPTTFRNSLRISAKGCSFKAPCSKCTGPCRKDSHCGPGLSCTKRKRRYPVPGCVTGDTGDVIGNKYCFEKPTNGTVTYIPGDLTKWENVLHLSTGLKSKIIAQANMPVQYVGGGKSLIDFHGAPDGAAIFEVTEGEHAGGYIYASNSEVGGGGVGAITFNAAGEVINYKKIVVGTNRNCGGGKTYWNTWVTCEENGTSGQVWEVDPAVGVLTQKRTVLGGWGGNYESFAYDARDRMNPTFYVTHDSSNGGLVRFTPNSNIVARAEATGDYSKVLTTMGTLEWLVLNPSSSDPTVGTFRWTNNISEGNSNASRYYRYSEGIDIRNGKMYFVTKVAKQLYILDLDKRTYEKSSTRSGAFSGQPDQIRSIISKDPLNDMLYFCEDGAINHGVHARDTDGNFYTILDSPTRSETSGLAFSPDNKHMYVSYQWRGLVYDITREDGYPFGAHRLDIKYHDT